MFRRGITLLELMVILAIIAVLLALLVPAVQKVRELAIRAESMNKQKQIALANHPFASMHHDRLPTLDGDAASANSGKSVLAAILPNF